MGDCLAKLGLYAEAIEKYRRAVHIDPASPEPHKKMDRLLSLQKDGKK
jgi:tetratricopeptide (TPR) repeat protein